MNDSLNIHHKLKFFQNSLERSKSEKSDVVGHEEEINRNTAWETTRR